MSAGAERHPLEDELSAVYMALECDSEVDPIDPRFREASDALNVLRAFLLPALWCEDGLPVSCDACDEHQGARTCNRVQEFNPHAWCYGPDVEDRAVTAAVRGGVL